MANTDILTATENYGKAQTAFQLALQEAARAREGAMISLGADITSTTGNVLNPVQAGKALGGIGPDKIQTITTGYGEGALPTVAKEQVGAVAATAEEAAARGIRESGTAAQAKLVAQEQGALATQEAIQKAQQTVAEAGATETQAKVNLEEAAAARRTAAGVRPKKKTKPAQATAQQNAARARASARAAANQKAKAQGKPMPYGKGGAPKPKKKK